MRFFHGTRPQVYLHGVKLRRDKKTGRRLWGFVLIVTLNASLVESCDVEMAKAWEYITCKESGAVDVHLLAIAAAQLIDFYAHVDDATPALHLEGVDLEGLRLTRDGSLVELWFQGEHENNAGLHLFMKEYAYAYTRFWAQFKSRQSDLPMGDKAKANLKETVVQAFDSMTEGIREGGITSMTFQIPGQEPIVIDKPAADRIHQAAKATRQKH